MDLDGLRKICGKLAGVTEDVKWGHDLVFSVGDKMFCVAGLMELPTSASFKVADDDFDDFCARDGFIPAPYMAKHKWVRIDDINRINSKEWVKFLTDSHRLVMQKLSAKKRKELGGN